MADLFPDDLPVYQSGISVNKTKKENQIISTTEQRKENFE
jgi:hypothetical protein